jgi:hypothetical protein
VKSELVVNAGRQYVEQMLACHQHFNKQGANILGDPTPVYEFVVANGQEWTGTRWTKFRGRGYRKMEKQMCFANAWYMSLIFDELTYYDGWASAGVWPVHHGWCVDDNGLVVDPTWRKLNHENPEEEWEYFGVGFDSHALHSWMCQKHTSSVLFDLNYNEGAMDFVVTA